MPVKPDFNPVYGNLSGPANEVLTCDNCGREIPPEHIKAHPNARFCPSAISNCKNRFWSRPYRRLRKLEKQVEELLKFISKD